MINSKTNYLIRINGAPISEFQSFDRYAIEEFARVCEERQGDFVDVVSVRTEILMNQYSYHEMKKHFSESQ